MSVASYIRALPKVDPIIQFVASVPRQTMLMFADQNEIGSTVKRFDKLLNSYEDPDFSKLDDLTQILSTWVVYHDDLARAVYDIGVALSKDNVRYAEIALDPLAFVSNELTFDGFMSAINDGRDRAKRAWDVDMRWLLGIPRNEPRRSDEVARWAASATAKDGGVVGIVLMGTDGEIDLPSFERAFQTAARKDVARLAYLHAKDDIAETVEALDLTGIIDAYGVLESPDTVDMLAEHDIAIYTGPTRAVASKQIKSIADFPVAEMIESGLEVLINTDVPILSDESLSDTYLDLIDSDHLSPEDLEALIARSIRRIHAEEDLKTQLLTELEEAIPTLRSEHLTEEMQ